MNEVKRWAAGFAALGAMLASGDAGAEEPGVLVFVRGSPDVRLEVYEGGDEWRRVCSAPCGERVRRDRYYRIRGPFPEGVPFAFGPADEVTVVVDEKPSPAVGKGRSMAIIGLAVTALSAIAFAEGIRLLNADAGCAGCQRFDSGVLAVTFGGIGLLTGTIVGVVGVSVWAGSPESTATMTVQSKNPSVGPVIKFAW